MQNSFVDRLLDITNVQKSEFVERLVSFVCSDTILFLPESDICREVVSKANVIFKTDFLFCQGFDINEHNVGEQKKTEKYFNECSPKKVLFIYLAATELRSVLCGVLFAEKEMSAEEVFQAAFYEELQQQKKWGKTEEISVRHSEILQKLKDMERYADERGLS